MKLQSIVFISVALSIFLGMLLFFGTQKIQAATPCAAIYSDLVDCINGCSGQNGNPVCDATVICKGHQGSFDACVAKNTSTTATSTSGSNQSGSSSTPATSTGGSAGSNVSNSTSTSNAACNPACLTGQTCINGSCMLVSHTNQANNQCNPACVSPAVCINGSCMMPAHTANPVGSGGAISNNIVPGQTTEGSQIIKCGRPGQSMCTLCDLIAGMNNIIQYIMKIAIGVALLAITIGGVMYVVSAGDTGLADMAKKTITNAAVGFVIIFAAYLIIDTTINYLGTKPGMGINVVRWGQFECAPGTH